MQDYYSWAAKSRPAPRPEQTMGELTAQIREGLDQHKRGAHRPETEGEIQVVEHQAPR